MGSGSGMSVWEQWQWHVCVNGQWQWHVCVCVKGQWLWAALSHCSEPQGAAWDGAGLLKTGPTFTTRPNAELTIGRHLNVGETWDLFSCHSPVKAISGTGFSEHASISQHPYIQQPQLYAVQAQWDHWPRGAEECSKISLNLLVVSADKEVSYTGTLFRIIPLVKQANVNGGRFLMVGAFF